VDYSGPIFVTDVERLVLQAITDRPENAGAVLEIIEHELRKRRTRESVDVDEINRLDALRQQLKAVAERRQA
jgi:hypothetical protein